MASGGWRARSRHVRVRLLTWLPLWYIRHVPIRYKKAGLYTRVVEPALIRDLGPVKAATRYGAVMGVGGADVIQRYIYSFGVWEPVLTAFIRERLQPGDTFIDVGANIGYYTLLASPLVGDSGEVVGIEASPSIFVRLQSNVALNGLGNVRTVHMAASNRREIVNVYRAPDTNLGATSLLASRGFEKEAEVQSDRLTAILAPEEITSARIIKIDVEGHEVAVLDGLISSLDDARPDLEVLLEVSRSELRLQGMSLAQLIDLWAEHGFHPYVLDNRYDPWVYAGSQHSSEALRFGSTPHDDEGLIDLVFSRRNVPALV